MTNEKLLFSKSFQSFHLVISLLQKIGYVKKKEWWLKRRKDGYKVHSPDRLGGLVSGNKNHFLKEYMYHVINDVFLTQSKEKRACSFIKDQKNIWISKTEIMLMSKCAAAIPEHLSVNWKKSVVLWWLRHLISC